MNAPDPETVRQYLLRRRISTWCIAHRLGIDCSHLQRVLTGKRPGSAALLRSVIEMAESIKRPRRSQEDIGRLIDAAAHVFFLKRGGFQSDIFGDTKGRG
jgi:hypothetical protein